MNTLSLSFEGQQVRFVGTSEKPEWVAADIVAILYPDVESKQRTTYLRKVPEEWKGKKAVMTPGGLQKMITLTEEGIRCLIVRSSSLRAKKLAQVLGIEILIPSKEQKCLGLIMESFSHLNPVPQFFVSGFRIDLYFPSHRIAVECDELDHNCYNRIAEKQRQDLITQVLGCQFIRFNPDEDNFCIGRVINRIIQTIYEEV